MGPGRAREGFMARKVNRLSARSVATLDRLARHADGGGLYLSISKNGADGFSCTGGMASTGKWGSGPSLRSRLPRREFW